LPFHDYFSDVLTTDLNGQSILWFFKRLKTNLSVGKCKSSSEKSIIFFHSNTGKSFIGTFNLL
jgi:hypothetical protein